MAMKMSSVFESSSTRFPDPKSVTPSFVTTTTATTRHHQPGSVRMSQQSGRHLRKGQVFYGERVPIGPGPAALNTPFNLNERRMRPRLAKPPSRGPRRKSRKESAVVGPGSYVTRGNILKPSFNRRLGGNRVVKPSGFPTTSRTTISSSRSDLKITFC